MWKTTGLQSRLMRNVLSIILAIVVLVVVVLSLSFSVYYYSNLESGLVTRARTTTDFFSTYISESYNEYYQACITFAQTFDEKDVMELQFVDTRGHVVASSYRQWGGEVPGTEDITVAISDGKIASFSGRSPTTGERIMAVSSPMIYSNGEVIGVLRYVTSLRLVERQIAALVLLFVLIGAAVIVFVMINGRYFVTSIIGPIAEINNMAKRIASGSYGAQIPPQHYNDEIGELANTINDMSVKIANSEKMQTEFISSVSHELRTPLTAITGWGETLLASEDMDPVVVKRGILTILKETRRLTRMVEELLEFTRIQDGRFTLNMETCDIRAEFEDAVFMYGSKLKQLGIALEYLENEEEIPEIQCDPARLRQVFLNILDNAAKHGGEGQRIIATIGMEEGQVAIRIRDFGSGIPEDELPHVKMKFYKGSSKARGNGIGLAVCDEIVTMHGGTLEIANAEGGGAEVTVRLPGAQ